MIIIPKTAHNHSKKIIQTNCSNIILSGTNLAGTIDLLSKKIIPHPENGDGEDIVIKE